MQASKNKIVLWEFLNILLHNRIFLQLKKGNPLNGDILKQANVIVAFWGSESPRAATLASAVSVPPRKNPDPAPLFHFV